MSTRSSNGVAALHDQAIGPAVLNQLAALQPELLVAAIEACPVNISIADGRASDFPLAYVNPSFTATTGYSAEEAIGRNCRFLQGPDTSRDAVQALRRSIETEQPVSVELLNYRKNGTPFLNSLRMAPVHDTDGRLISFIGIQADVTAERQRAKTDLHRQRVEALGQLAGGMAHQLNNLLQPIITLASLHRPAIGDPEIASDVDVLLESARQAADVVRGALAFARRSEAVASDACLADMVREQVAFIRSMLPVTVRVHVTVAAEAETLRAPISATQLSQVLANLMINASNAMAGDGRVDIELTLHEQGAAVTVRDNGPGIPPDIRAKIFEPFFTTRPEKGGTGLGLSVVREIMKSVGGAVHVQSVDATQSRPGCQFDLILPTVA